jgi:predicted nuclease of predicted toxin-antitoxin system
VVSERLRFHLDENISNAVASALRRYGIDITTSVDAGLRQADDLAHLAFATREGRVLVTHDADFLRYHAQEIGHTGIAYCGMGERTLGEIIAQLRLMYEVLTAEEMNNRVEYL